MKPFIKLFLLLLLANSSLFAQTYPNHFGTGNNVGVTTTSSPTQNTDSIQNTLSGTGYFMDETGLYRFMAQAGFGAIQADIDSLQQMGIENWIDWQMNMPFTTYVDKYFAIRDSVITNINAQDFPEETDTGRPYWYAIMSFWDKAITEQDILRQKAAFALSQIFVISISDSYTDRGHAIAHYYDILYEGAFGNFKDLLHTIALNPAMGKYLNHYENNKEIDGIKPDENFARELMQLFTIGLIELNNDGTAKLDVNGNPIPTYNNTDVQEMAKVFTGLTTGAIDTAWTNTNFIDFSVPMIIGTRNGINIFASQENHDITEKYILGDTIPANQTGEQDIDDAIDILFHHPNTGPFIAYRLIQQLVKSNPTPEYINRVATVFNNNGNNIRGDMGAVFKAILLDTEARDCEWIDHPTSGKLLQPMERFINLFKAFNITTPSGNYWLIDRPYTGQYQNGLNKYMRQSFLSSPSVFNFFSPFYVEPGLIDSLNMVSPEFQILDDVSALHYLNRINDAIKRIAVHPYDYFNSTSNKYGAQFANYTGTKVKVSENRVTFGRDGEDRPFLDYTDEVNICETEGYEALIDHLDLKLCRGQLNPTIKAHILNHLNNATYSNSPCGVSVSNDFETNWATGKYRHSAVKDAIYFIMISSSYAILK